MLEARVKPEGRWKNITAFSGREFTKDEWRPVPAGFEEEAGRNEHLELRKAQGGASAPAAEAAEEPTREEQLQELSYADKKALGSQMGLEFPGNISGDDLVARILAAEAAAETNVEDATGDGDADVEQAEEEGGEDGQDEDPEGGGQ